MSGALLFGMLSTIVGVVFVLIVEDVGLIGFELGELFLQSTDAFFFVLELHAHVLEFGAQIFSFAVSTVLAVRGQHYSGHFGEELLFELFLKATVDDRYNSNLAVGFGEASIDYNRGKCFFFVRFH